MSKGVSKNNSGSASSQDGAKQKKSLDVEVAGVRHNNQDGVGLKLSEMPELDGHDGDGLDGQESPEAGQDGHNGEPQALTRREIQVLKMLALGLSSKEIATKFKISAKTVDVHRAIIRRKLGIYNIPGLVKYALRTGLINLEE